VKSWVEEAASGFERVRIAVRRECVGRSGKGGKAKRREGAYRLSLCPAPAQDELVYPPELSLDSFVVRFELEGPLEICLVE
jgi:hypothetical protein